MGLLMSQMQRLPGIYTADISAAAMTSAAMNDHAFQAAIEVSACTPDKSHRLLDVSLQNGCGILLSADHPLQSSHHPGRSTLPDQLFAVSIHTSFIPDCPLTGSISGRRSRRGAVSTVSRWWSALAATAATAATWPSSTYTVTIHGLCARFHKRNVAWFEDCTRVLGRLRAGRISNSKRLQQFDSQREFAWWRRAR